MFVSGSDSARVRLCSNRFRVRIFHIEPPSNNRRRHINFGRGRLIDLQVNRDSSYFVFGAVRQLRLNIRPRGGAFLLRYLFCTYDGVTILASCRFQVAFRRHRLQARQDVREHGLRASVATTSGSRAAKGINRFRGQNTNVSGQVAHGSLGEEGRHFHSHVSGSLL